MAEIETSLKPILGGCVSNRVFPNRIDQASDLPAITYSSARAPITTIHSAVPVAQDVRITVTVVADSFHSARSTAIAIRSAVGSSNLDMFLVEEPGDGFDDETQLHLYTLVYGALQT